MRHDDTFQPEWKINFNLTKEQENENTKEYLNICVASINVMQDVYKSQGLALAEYKKSPQFIEIVDFVAFRLSVVLESQRCVRDSNP